MSRKAKKPLLFRIIKALVRTFYKKYEVIGKENLPEDACVIVGNHSQLHGPIACELYLEDNCITWCAGEMMELKKVPSYAYKDFWSKKPKYTRPFFKLASWLIAPLSVLIFNNARTIAVHKDKKIINTFKDTVLALKNKNNVVIFPEHDVTYNNIVYDFQNGFIDVAKIYYKRTKKELSFVPLYIAPNLKKMYLGKPIKFSGESPFLEERERVCKELMLAITDIAEGLPLHKVVPYRNINKKLYPLNVKKE